MTEPQGISSHRRYTKLMPTGLRRYQQCGDAHFITFSCYERRPYLGTPQARDLLLETLGQASERYRCKVEGFVVMPEHVHLLLYEPLDGALSSLLRSLKQSIAQRSERRPFWYPRYYDFNVFTEEKRLEKLSYMEFNPVKRGLCGMPGDWRWTSAGFAFHANTHLIGFAAGDGAPSAPVVRASFDPDK